MVPADNLWDQLVLKQMIESWAIWRDVGDWDRLAELWHPQGRMSATWFEGSAARFIEMGRAAMKGGARSYHVLGGSSVVVNGRRAIGNTRFVVYMRSSVHGEPCDITCVGRFYDRFQKYDDRWGLLHRQPIYEQNRLDPVRPGAVIELDAAVLERFPVGYRYLAYVQTAAGLDVNPMLPATGGAPLEPLVESTEAWLASC